MSELRPIPIPVAAWRSRLTRWHKAVVSACVTPQSVTLMRLSSEEVAAVLRENRNQPRV